MKCINTFTGYFVAQCVELLQLHSSNLVFQNCTKQSAGMVGFLPEEEFCFLAKSNNTFICTIQAAIMETPWQVLQTQHGQYSFENVFTALESTRPGWLQLWMYLGCAALWHLPRAAYFSSSYSCSWLISESSPSRAADKRHDFSCGKGNAGKERFHVTTPWKKEKETIWIQPATFKVTLTLIMGQQCPCRSHFNVTLTQHFSNPATPKIYFIKITISRYMQQGDNW